MNSVSQMAIKVDEYWKKTNDLIVECQRHCFITRCIEILRSCSDQLQAAGAQCQEFKKEAIEAADEDTANALMSIEFMLRAEVNEIGMWIALKEDKAQQAWDDLIVAQGCVRAALKCHRIGMAIEGYAKRLHAIEHVLFPRQTFFSSAHIVDHYECSVCQQEYGTCGHVVGRAYMGELCSKIAKGIKAVQHVAIMLDNDPMDKRCRATSTCFEDGDRDTLTWRIVPNENGDNKRGKPEPGYGRMTVCLLRADAEPGI